MGIEPTFPAWKAEYYRYTILAHIWSERRDSNPQHPLCRWRLTIEPLSHNWQMKGVEPPRQKALDPKSSASANFATSASCGLPGNRTSDTLIKSQVPLPTEPSKPNICRDSRIRNLRIPQSKCGALPLGDGP